MAKPKEFLIPRPEEPASNASASAAAASVVGISKRFGKASVLENISFDVGEGEALVLLGASGSGKTTILRIIAGLEQPYTGKVILHGKDVSELPARERGVGVIFQSYALFPRMTVEKNIGYGLRIRLRPPKESYPWVSAVPLLGPLLRALIFIITYPAAFGTYRRKRKENKEIVNS